MDVMSACGVLCSGCAAYLGFVKGVEHQQQSADAWMRIYSFTVKAEELTCGGCLGSDEEVFYSCRRCTARSCCRSKGFNSCAECSVESCQMLERAQSVWDEVPIQINILSSKDFDAYARPYCGHRERLENARQSFRIRE